MKKTLKIFLWSCAAGFVLILGAAAVVHYFYSEEVKQYVIKSIESNLAVKMNIESAEFSMWTQFPKASVDLKNVWVEDGLSPGDTLLRADEVSLAFNLFSLLGGSYRLSRVSVEQGIVFIRYDEEGRDNFHFWKQNEQESSSAQLVLDRIYLEAIEFNYTDARENTEFSCFISDLDLDGKIRSPDSAFDLDGVIQMKDLAIDEEHYLKDQEVLVEGELKGRQDFSELEFEELQVKLRGGSILVNGDWASGRANISLTTRSAEPELMSALIPGFWGDLNEKYIIEALFDFQGNYIVQEEKTELKGIVEIVDGNIEHRSSGEWLRNIRGRSEITIREDIAFSVEELAASFKNGRLRASGDLALGDNTLLDLSFGGSIDLSEVKGFLGLDSLYELAGTLEVDMKAKGSMENNQDGWPSGMVLEGKLALSDGEFQASEAGLYFEDIKANALLTGNDLAIEQLSGATGGNTFAVKGFLRNVVPSIFGKESSLLVETTFEAPLIDLNHWLGQSNSGSSETGSSIIPEKLSLNLNLKVEELRYNDFTATQINGVARMENGAIRLIPVEFKAAKGSVRGDITLMSEDNGTYTWACDADLRKLDIKELFRQFGNFGQEVLTDRNLQGTASALVSFRAGLDNNLILDTRSVESLIEITLENGELSDVEAFNQISDYLRKNKLIASYADPDAFEKELQHIVFSTIRNQIDIRDGKIRIPSMDIESSAMDISLSGVHYFDNRIDYSFNFRLRDIRKKRQSEFGEEEDDELGSRFFLSMKGTTDNPVFGFDRTAAKEKRKEDREKERQEFRQLLKDEFGLFRKDPTLRDANTAGKPAEEVKMTIVWDDDTTAVKETKGQPPKGDNRNKKSWKDRLSGEEEEEAPSMYIEDEER
jgi:uncharacterized protein involved in outer membrane biogenesis